MVTFDIALGIVVAAYAYGGLWSILYTVVDHNYLKTRNTGDDTGEWYRPGFLPLDAAVNFVVWPVVLLIGISDHRRALEAWKTQRARVKQNEADRAWGGVLMTAWSGHGKYLGEKVTIKLGETQIDIEPSLFVDLFGLGWRHGNFRHSIEWRKTAEKADAMAIEVVRCDDIHGRMELLRETPTHDARVQLTGPESAKLRLAGIMPGLYFVSVTTERVMKSAVRHLSVSPGMSCWDEQYRFMNWGTLEEI